MAATMCADGKSIRPQLSDLVTGEIWPLRPDISVGIDIQSLTELIEQRGVVRLRHQQQDHQRPHPFIERHPVPGHLCGHRIAEAVLCLAQLRLQPQFLNQRFDLVGRVSQNRLDAERNPRFEEHRAIVDEIGDHEEDAGRATAQEDRANHGIAFGKSIVEGQADRRRSALPGPRSMFEDLLVAGILEIRLQVVEVLLELGGSENLVMLDVRHRLVGDQVVAGTQDRLGKHPLP